MAKSIIVYGVKGGKTRFAQRIANYFGLKLANGYSDFSVWKENYCYFSEAEPTGGLAHHGRSFQEVADEINAAIPLTDWQSGPPPMVGEWNASNQKDSHMRRWWDGWEWSGLYYEAMSEPFRNVRASIKYGTNQNLIQWRGLSAEPIKVTE